MSFCRIVPFVASALSLLVGACAPVAVTMVSYGADGVSLLETGKSTTDHLASMVSRKDCAFWRMFRGDKICRERPDDHDPYKVDYSQPTPQPSEDGVAYAPPLRGPADAPATSWTSDTYAAAPTETGSGGSAPVVAAERAPAPMTAAPTVSPEQPAMAGKSKIRVRAKPVRRASRGQAASLP